MPGCGSIELRCDSVRDGRGRRGQPRLHALREERRHDAGQHVAGPGGRECGRSVRGDEDALARRGDERVGALQQDHRAEARSGATSGVETVGVDLLRIRAEQPCELAAVRRQHGRGRAGERLQLPQRVGVEHDRQLELLEQDPHQLDRPVGASEARPDRDRVRLLGGFEHCVDRAREQATRRVLRQRPLDHLEQSRLEDRQRRLRRRNRDVARVGAKRRQRRQHRRTGQAARAADDQHGAGRVFRRRRLLAGNLEER